ncbi:glycosyltransferase [Thermoanaerobacterium thermosaccharolyticum]|uniref:Glycosyltransferase n=2 Tax=Thermoanaerobacterium thermosaccharolyticum TaxID=1517 RepID=A0A223I1G9_THETR|nr:glycosyltransferase [Thermoanaerobacterium thermosaccharolyticum]AST58539.1 glycosyltransferase [Thermoanaerobacterium thermosaccharolyticum]
MGVYNGCQYLKKSIESIINQTYKDWEFIICDDCSEDNTIEIISEYLKKDDRIKLIKNDRNLGLAATLNRCLNYVNGDYIARQDADDISMPNRLEEETHFLNKNKEYSLVGSSVYLIDENDNIYGYNNLKREPTKFDLIKGPTFVHPTIMVRRELFAKLYGYANWALRVEDYELWMRMYAAGYKGYNIETPLLKYRVSKNDYSKRRFKYRLIETKVRYIGYKNLDLPLWSYLYTLKPIVAGIIPKKIMYQYHKKKFRI